MSCNPRSSGCEPTRSEEFQTNPELDELIVRLRKLLEPIQIKENGYYNAPRYPVILLVGCPRSGITAFSQFLAASESFAYPTNLLSRFAYAPIIGAMIQQMLFNPAYDHRQEFSDIQSHLDFNSNLGKTRGALNISEFFHFWRKFFPNNDPQFIPENELTKVKISRMRQEIASIESVFAKPLMSKGKMFQFNIDYFSQKIPELFFVYIKRDVRFVLQSILLSRRKYFQTDNIWWGIKPKEYNWLSRMTPTEQVAGQVFFTEKSLDRQIENLSENRKFTCRYEDLCENPQEIYQSLRTKLEYLGCNLNNYKIPRALPCGNEIKLSEFELRKLEIAYAKFSA